MKSEDLFQTTRNNEQCVTKFHPGSVSITNIPWRIIREQQETCMAFKLKGSQREKNRIHMMRKIEKHSKTDKTIIKYMQGTWC